MLARGQRAQDCEYILSFVKKVEVAEKMLTGASPPVASSDDDDTNVTAIIIGIVAAVALTAATVFALRKCKELLWAGSAQVQPEGGVTAAPRKASSGRKVAPSR